MRGWMRKAALAVLLVVSAAYASGCLFLLGGAAAGAAVMYVRGEGKKAYAADLEKARLAVIAALEEDLHLPVLHKDQDAVSARIESVTSDRKKIVAVLTRESNEITMVKVRVGPFGDQTFTQAIFDAIDKRLGA